jgi:hypothetical protein
MRDLKPEMCIEGDPEADEPSVYTNLVKKKP